MILGFMQKFADGTPTFFYEKIVRSPTLKHGYKIHSIRKGKRWRKGMSVQMAHGVRSKNYWQFNKGIKYLSECVSTQDIFMTFIDENLEITVSGRYLLPLEIELLIQNDGISREQFINHFFPKKIDEFSGQIIHWTDFKY